MPKTYDIILTFNVPSMKITARNKAEARRKLRAHLKRIPASRFVDHKNTYLDEI